MPTSGSKTEKHILTLGRSSADVPACAVEAVLAYGAAEYCIYLWHWRGNRAIPPICYFCKQEVV